MYFMKNILPLLGFDEFKSLFDYYDQQWLHELSPDDLYINNDTIVVLEDSLIMFNTSQRIILFIINLVLLIIAVVGNLCVIIVNIKRKSRYMYKCYLISLASADLLMASFTGTEHLATLSGRMLVWHLGQFMCSFLPFTQITALLVNSVTLTCIAMYRYQTIVQAFRFKWNPTPCYSNIVILSIWLISAGIAYPMFMTYYCVDLLAVRINENNEITKMTEVQRCITNHKKENAYYFAILLTFLFLPLLITFLWLYLHIASLIWVKTRPMQRMESETSNNTTETSEDTNKNASHFSSPQRILTKHSKEKMKRKLRTFKVILILMIIFFVCRLPVWIFMVLQMAMVLNKPRDWFIAYSLNLISYTNSALNPFLYTFLNETILYGEKIRNTILNCLGKTEKNEKNSDNEQQPDINNKVTEKNINCAQQVNRSPIIIPRGPYSEQIIRH